MRRVLPVAFAGREPRRAGNRERWNWQKFSCECSQDFVARDRQVFHAAADRVENRNGNSGNSRNFAGFADALGAIGSEPIVAFDEYDFDVRRIAMRHDPVTVESGCQRLAVSAIVDQVFMQRHSNTHQDAAFNLASRRQGIDDAPAPMSVTPTNTVYFPLASRRMTALLRPRAERNAMNATPAPRFTGPGSEPGCGRHRFFHSNVSAPRRMQSSRL